VDFFQRAVDMYKTLDSYHVRPVMESGIIDRRKQKLTLQNYRFSPKPALSHRSQQHIHTIKFNLPSRRFTAMKLPFNAMMVS
jgi:hypothetical protein